MRLLTSEDMIVIALPHRGKALAFVSACLEASEGLGVIVGERGATPHLVGPKSREGALLEFLHDMSHEVVES